MKSWDWIRMKRLWWRGAGRSRGENRNGVNVKRSKILPFAGGTVESVQAAAASLSEADRQETLSRNAKYYGMARCWLHPLADYFLDEFATLCSDGDRPSNVVLVAGEMRRSRRRGIMFGETTSNICPIRNNLTHVPREIRSTRAPWMDTIRNMCFVFGAVRARFLTFHLRAGVSPARFYIFIALRNLSRSWSDVPRALNLLGTRSVFCRRRRAPSMCYFTAARTNLCPWSMKIHEINISSGAFRTKIM